MMGSFLNRVLILVFGYAYPAYQCFKTVELNKPEIEQLRFWCQYWILVAVLAVLESFGDVFLSWLPMYSEGKLALYIFLWYPKLRGTNYVYDTFFKPYLTKYESEIDCNLHELRVRAADIMLMYWQKAAIYGRTSFFEVLNYVILMVQTSRTRVIQKTQQPQQPEQAQQSSHQEPPQDAKMPSTPIKQRVQEHPKRSSSVHHRASSPASPSHQATTSLQTQQERKVSHSPVKKRIALKPVSPAQPQGPGHESDGTETRNKPPSPREEAEDDSNPPADESHIDEAIHSARSRLRKRGLSSRCKMKNGKQIIDQIPRVKNKSSTLRYLTNPHKSPSTCASASSDAATALHRSAGDGEEVDTPSNRLNGRRLLFPHFLVRIHVREGIGSEGARRPDRRSPAQQCHGLGRHDDGRSGSEVSLRYFGHAGFDYNWSLFPSFEGTCDDWEQSSSCSRLSLVENDSR